MSICFPLRLQLLVACVPLMGGTCSAADLCNSCPLLCRTCGEKVCITVARPATETKHCWDVEFAEVCIPPVRFPWHCGKRGDCADCVSAPLPGCGKVRCVRKLRKVDYECDTCKYEHKIVCRCPNCGPLSRDDCLPLTSSNARGTYPLLQKIGHSQQASR